MDESSHNFEDESYYDPSKLDRFSFDEEYYNPYRSPPDRIVLDSADLGTNVPDSLVESLPEEQVVDSKVYVSYGKEGPPEWAENKDLVMMFCPIAYGLTDEEARAIVFPASVPAPPTDGVGSVDSKIYVPYGKEYPLEWAEIKDLMMMYCLLAYGLTDEEAQAIVFPAPLANGVGLIPIERKAMDGLPFFPFIFDAVAMGSYVKKDDDSPPADQVQH